MLDLHHTGVKQSLSASVAGKSPIAICHSAVHMLNGPNQLLLHIPCDLLSHTMSALLSPVLMLCNLLCRSAAGSSPLWIAAYFATYTWPWYCRMLCNLLLRRVQALQSRLLQPVGPQRSRRAAGRDALCSAAVLEHAAPVLWPGLLSWKQ